MKARKDSGGFEQTIPVALSYPGRARLLLNLHHLQQFQEASLHSNRTPATHAYGVPMRRSGIEIISPLSLIKRGNRYILAIADYFTKVAKADPMKSQNAETVASIFFNVESAKKECLVRSIAI